MAFLTGASAPDPGPRELRPHPGPDTAVAELRELLAHFQGTGEFRAGFDPLAMAMAIRAAIDAVPPRLARDPGFDIAHYGRELADLFDLATSRRGPAVC